MKRYPGAARGYQFYYIAACIQRKKVMCMSPRQLRKYWNEPSMDVSPASCYSRLLEYRYPCWSKMLKRRRVKHI